jgi:hypothetical protein
VRTKIRFAGVVYTRLYGYGYFVMLN